MKMDWKYFDVKITENFDMEGSNYFYLSLILKPFPSYQWAYAFSKDIQNAGLSICGDEDGFCLYFDEKNGLTLQEYINHLQEAMKIAEEFFLATL